MPIYEYQCQACGYNLEVLQKISDPLLQECPNCGKSALKKMVSAPSFRLSGTGWYETDFKSDNKRNLSTGDSNEKPAQKKAESKDHAKTSAASDKKASSGKTAEKKTSSGSNSVKKSD